MKKFRKLLPALSMLLISALLMGSSTFAWFSMNTTVTVSGMSVTTKVSSNLLISADTTEANFKAAGLDQTRSGALDPVSTVDGKSFFYHNSENVDASGAQTGNHFTAYSEDTTLANTGAGKESYDSSFNSNYGVTGSITTNNVVYGYIDYIFYLKASSTEESQKVSLTKCNLLYNGNTINGNKAWRVAVFATEASDTAEGAKTATESLKTILTLSDAKNFSNTVTDSKNQAASSATALADVTYNSAAVIDSTIAKGTSKYYKVIVRIYLEGEDTTCNNATYVNLTQAFTLSLEFKIGTDDGVTNISSINA